MDEAVPVVRTQSKPVATALALPERTLTRPA